MIYQLFIEGREADINEQISVQLTLAIDDINRYGSRDTSFSKTIVLPGTNNNNSIFGNIAELGSSNPYTQGSANVGVNFNVAQISRAELRLNGLLICKGVFRLTGIVRNKSLVEYEGSIFGELGGFIANIGNKKLEDLDFSEYDHEYNTTNIKESWDATTTKNASFYTFEAATKQIGLTRSNFPSLYVGLSITISGSDSNDGTYTIASVSITQNQYLVYTTVITVVESIIDEFGIGLNITYSSFGSGYYYPLIDYGTYSTGKVNYDIKTFRPALFVKEYLDKMFASAGYTYESEFFNTDMFRRLIIPSNAKDLTANGSLVLDGNILFAYGESNPYVTPITQEFTNYKANNFTYSSGQFTYTQPSSFMAYARFEFYGVTNAYIMIFNIRKNGTIVGTKTLTFYDTYNTENFFNDAFATNFVIGQNDVIEVTLAWGHYPSIPDKYISYNANLTIESEVPVDILVNEGDEVSLNNAIPKNILQKDFFGWILRMFNLYVTEDKLIDKKLIIEPYKDYYDLTSFEDWSYKVAHDKAWQIKPMGMLNGRFFEYKFKEDSDFYNEGYKKKYNQSYGDRLEDTGFQFAKDKQTIEIGFSPTVLVNYEGVDKVVPAIYKKSGNTEDRMDSNIRILLAKKITGVTAWDILDGVTVLENDLTVYGYAGHFDDPDDPTVDINFGAAFEIYFSPNSYTSNNLFNVYWSGYIAEIADKDSKLLTCYVYLNELDLANLDFSKPVFIDGVLWRINKVMDYDATNNELTKVELLKVINNG